MTDRRADAALYELGRLSFPDVSALVFERVSVPFRPYVTVVEPGSVWRVGELLETIVSSKRLVTFINRRIRREVGGLTGTGNRPFGEKIVKKNQLRHKIRTTESDFESFMEDNGRGQWGR